MYYSMCFYIEFCFGVFRSVSWKYIVVFNWRVSVSRRWVIIQVMSLTEDSYHEATSVFDLKLLAYAALSS